MCTIEIGASQMHREDICLNSGARLDVAEFCMAQVNRSSSCCRAREINRIQLLNLVGWRQNAQIIQTENSVISMLLPIAVRERSCMELSWVQNLTTVRQGNLEQWKKKILELIPQSPPYPRKKQLAVVSPATVGLDLH